MTKISLQTGAGAGSHEMKEKDIGNEKELAGSLTLCFEKRAAIKQFVKEMPTWYSSCNMDFRRLAEESKLGVGEELSANLDLVLTHPP